MPKRRVVIGFIALVFAVSWVVLDCRPADAATSSTTLEVCSFKAHNLPSKQIAAVSFNEPLNGHWGWYGLVKATSSPWGQFYAGPQFSSKHFKASVDIGFESSKQKTRFAAWMTAKYGRFSTLIAWEDGQSGRWHKRLLKYQAMPRLAFLAWDQQSLGIGPRVEFSITRPDPSKPQLVVYAATMFNHQVTSPVVGLIKTF